MAGVQKKKMTAKLKVDATAEMAKTSKAFIARSKLLKSRFGAVTHERSLLLDPRKWDEKKLSKALEVLVRYELKVLGVRVAEAVKLVEKKGDAVRKAAEEKLAKDVEKAKKLIADKCATALEEVEADKGDNKRGLRDGKASLKKMSDLDLKAIFAGPGSKALEAIATLSRELSRDDANGAAAKIAKTLAEARDDFVGQAKDAQGALKALLDAKGGIDKRETAPELDKFATGVNGHKSTFLQFSTELGKYKGILDEVTALVSSGKIERKHCSGLVKRVEIYRDYSKTASAVRGAVESLRKTFITAEKALR
ncbi:MAG: hypothetical protein AAF713_16725 [Pseudomonadota bacterium]